MWNLDNHSIIAFTITKQEIKKNKTEPHSNFNNQFTIHTTTAHVRAFTHQKTKNF